MSTRLPWRRTVIKLGANLFGKRYRHYHGWWPYLRVGQVPGKAIRTIFYRNCPVVDLSSVASLLNRTGKEITIVGSGPSIKLIEVASLPEHSAILLNGAISLIPDSIAYPLAVAMEDERFVWKHAALLRDHLPPETPLLLSVPVIRALCDIDPTFLRDRQVLLIDDLRKPYGRPRRSPAEIASLPFAVISSDGRYGFSNDPDAGVFMGHSVAVSATQFAVACNPATVGFAGIDLSNDSQPRFYEHTGERAPSGLSGSLDIILGHIAIARDCACERGIIFRNYSHCSALSQIDIIYDPRLATGVQAPPTAGRKSNGP